MARTFFRHILFTTILVASISISAVAQAIAPANSFGFNYWPSGYLTNTLFDVNWATQRNMVMKDVLQMKSLGVGIVRLTFWANGLATGWNLSANGSGSSFDSHYFEVKKNLPDLLKMFADHNIKVIINFYNGNIADTPAGHSHPLWMDAYGNTQAGWIYFLRDSQIWMNGIVTAAENSPSKSTVLYYDMENEWWQNEQNTYAPGANYGQWYLNFIYDHVAIPVGKHGVSTLATYEFAKDIQTALGGRHLDYYDTHSYPADYAPSGEIETVYDFLHNLFPSSTIVLGEFGRRDIQGGEAQQVATFMNIRQRALAKGYRYTLNWNLWDDPVSRSLGFGYGFGVNPAAIRDLYGAYVNSVGFLTNPDFEWGNCQGQPYGWAMAAVAGVRVSLQHNTAAVDSGLCNGRLIAQTSVVGAQSWMCTSTQTGALRGKTKFYADFYLRSTFRNVQLLVFQYRGDDSYITSTASPGFNYSMSEWPAWRNFMDGVGAWYVNLSPEAVSGAVCIMGQAQSGTNYLDVDAVSAWAE